MSSAKVTHAAVGNREGVIAMTCLFARSLAALVGLAAAELVQAAEVHVPFTLSADKSGFAIAQAADFQAEATTITLQENEEIVFAELNFQDELPPGTEIELWPAVDGETPPWELVGDDFPFPRNLWLTDERTGSFIRFEVTEVVRAWQSGELANLGFLVRIPEEPGVEAGQSASARITRAKEAVLTYHVLPVRPPKASESPEEPPARTTPRVEDGSGRE
jgi:hypothetical protein